MWGEEGGALSSGHCLFRNQGKWDSTTSQPAEGSVKEKQKLDTVNYAVHKK